MRVEDALECSQQLPFPPITLLVLPKDDPWNLTLDVNEAVKEATDGKRQVPELSQEAPPAQPGTWQSSPSALDRNLTHPQPAPAPASQNLHIYAYSNYFRLQD